MIFQKQSSSPKTSKESVVVWMDRGEETAQSSVRERKLARLKALLESSMPQPGKESECWLGYCSAEEENAEINLL